MAYLDLVGTFIYKEPLFRAKLGALANNDAQLKTDGWAAATKTTFFQAAVPTGWTQDVSQNDKALRVVGSIGGGGSGGSQGLSATITLGHTHSISSDDAHTHAYANHTHRFTSGAGGGSNLGVPTSYYKGNTGGFFFRLPITGSPTGTVSVAKDIMSTPGSITLGTLAAHDHGGATDHQLSDIVLSYCDVIIGTKNAISGTYTDLTSYWHTGDKIDFDPFQSSANNDAYNYGALMPSGSISLFVQGSSPTGWTKLSSLDDRMLRIVSGAGGGVGGSAPISSGINLAHTHTLTATADHTHSIPNHVHLIDQTQSVGGLYQGSGSTTELNQSAAQADGSSRLVDSQSSGGTSTVTGYKMNTTNSGAGNTSAAGGHTHEIPSQLADIQFAYLDIIQCSKDSAGSPYSYTDYTAEFAWKKLVTYQRLNTLAKNDSYIHFHTTPATTGMLFFMASPPTGWSKITSHDDMALRVVSGGSGGATGGGSQGLSSTITLGHAHTIVAGGGHQHTADHTHPLDSGSVTATAATSTVVCAKGGSRLVESGNTGGSIVSTTPLGTVSNNPDPFGAFPDPPVADPDHNHGGATGSALSDVSLAYADVIYCTKS